MSQNVPLVDAQIESDEAADAVKTMLGFATAVWISRAVAVAAELGLADMVKTGPKTAEQLAKEANCHPESLLRLLRAVSAIGLFGHDDQGLYHRTPLSATLETGAPFSLRYFAPMVASGEHYEAWHDLIHSVRTGETAFDRHFQKDVWTYYRENPEQERRFQMALMSITEAFDPAILGVYDFTKVRTVVDIAGGHGALLRAILGANQEAKGVLFDAPHVIDLVRPSLTGDRTLAPRLRLVGGDFFKAVPRGGDLYILKWILHDWDDARCVTILQNCRNAMGQGSRLLIIENLIDGSADPMGKFMDLNMMVMTGGRERTSGDFKRLFRDSGFKLNRIIPTQTPLSIVEAVPVPLTK